MSNVDPSSTPAQWAEISRLVSRITAQLRARVGAADDDLLEARVFFRREVDPKIVDVMAKGAHARSIIGGPHAHRSKYGKPWGEGHPSIETRLRADMAAALKALEEAGYAVVRVRENWQ